MATLFWPKKKLSQSFSYLKNPFNTATLLICSTARFLWPFGDCINGDPLWLQQEVALSFSFWSTDVLSAILCRFPAAVYTKIVIYFICFCLCFNSGVWFVANLYWVFWPTLSCSSAGLLGMWCLESCQTNMVVVRFSFCLPVSCAGWPLQVLLSRGTGFMPSSDSSSALV